MSTPNPIILIAEGDDFVGQDLALRDEFGEPPALAVAGSRDVDADTQRADAVEVAGVDMVPSLC
jgi:hypothetical protein